MSKDETTRKNDVHPLVLEHIELQAQLRASTELSCDGKTRAIVAALLQIANAIKVRK